MSCINFLSFRAVMGKVPIIALCLAILSSSLSLQAAGHDSANPECDQLRLSKKTKRKPKPKPAEKKITNPYYVEQFPGKMILAELSSGDVCTVDHKHPDERSEFWWQGHFCHHQRLVKGTEGSHKIKFKEGNTEVYPLFMIRTRLPKQSSKRRNAAYFLGNTDSGNVLDLISYRSRESGEWKEIGRKKSIGPLRRGNQIRLQGKIFEVRAFRNDAIDYSKVWHDTSLSMKRIGEWRLQRHGAYSSRYCDAVRTLLLLAKSSSGFKDIKRVYQPKQTLAECLRYQIISRMQARDLSEDDIAAKLGFFQVSGGFRKLLHGTSRRPDAKVVRSIADILNCTVKDITTKEVFFNGFKGDLQEMRTISELPYDPSGLDGRVASFVDDMIVKSSKTLTRRQHQIYLDVVYLRAFQSDGEIHQGHGEWFLNLFKTM